ncbi:MAG: hypothetical protein K2N64_02285 [Anaeroplasmataceae bacterium]|nr:hypothetical protein [Anaeroplasmataceae bacterium]
MRIHLLEDEIEVYKKKYSFFKNKYIQISNKKIKQLKNIEYLYHYLRFESIMIQCFSQGTWYFLEIFADYVELEWIGMEA